MHPPKRRTESVLSEDHAAKRVAIGHFEACFEGGKIQHADVMRRLVYVSHSRSPFTMGFFWHVWMPGSLNGSLSDELRLSFREIMRMGTLHRNIQFQSILEMDESFGDYATRTISWELFDPRGR